jgi:hypothetical protein
MPLKLLLYESETKVYIYEELPCLYFIVIFGNSMKQVNRHEDIQTHSDMDANIILKSGNIR